MVVLVVKVCNHAKIDIPDQISQNIGTAMSQEIGHVGRDWNNAPFFCTFQRNQSL